MVPSSIHIVSRTSSTSSNITSQYSSLFASLLFKKLLISSGLMEFYKVRTNDSNSKCILKHDIIVARSNHVFRTLEKNGLVGKSNHFKAHLPYYASFPRMSSQKGREHTYLGPVQIGYQVLSPKSLEVNWCNLDH